MLGAIIAGVGAGAKERGRQTEKSQDEEARRAEQEEAYRRQIKLMQMQEQAANAREKAGRSFTAEQNALSRDHAEGINRSQLEAARDRYNLEVSANTQSRLDDMRRYGFDDARVYPGEISLTGDPMSGNMTQEQGPETRLFYGDQRPEYRSGYSSRSGSGNTPESDDLVRVRAQIEDNVSARMSEYMESGFHWRDPNFNPTALREKFLREEADRYGVSHDLLGLGTMGQAIRGFAPSGPVTGGGGAPGFDSKAMIEAFVDGISRSEGR